MNTTDGLNMTVYPAYVAEILYAGLPIEGVPDLRRLAAPGYEPIAHRIPDADNVAVIGKGKFESRITLPVESYVWAFSGYSSDADGFKVSIQDVGSGSSFFNGKVKDTLLSGQGQLMAGAAFPLVIMEQPRIVIEPGLISVQVENLAAAVNQIYVVLWTAEPGRSKTA